VLEVKFEGKSINDILMLTIDDAIEHFKTFKQDKIIKKLQPFWCFCCIINAIILRFAQRLFRKIRVVKKRN